MGRLVITEFVSLDGVFEDPGGAEDFEHGGWVFRFNRGEEGDQFKFDEILAADVQLLGRRTYEGFAEAWPSRTDEIGFSDRMNSMPKCVVSTTLKQADWNNTQVIRADVPEQIAKLKAGYDRDILIAGSATLVQSLMAHDLIDEYRLMVFPIVLGSGRRLFPDGVTKTTLRLTGSRSVGPDGVVILTYEPVRSPMP